MRWHTVETLGDKQGLTPEGFLLCRDVPIARTGTQIYHATEIPGLVPNQDGLLRIEREASEVFHPDSIASFEGKPIVNDHPMEDVTPANWKDLAIGHVSNVRRGNGADGDVLLADMLFTDQEGIDLVRSGKRAVSVGYDAHYSQLDAGYGKQSNITCNHVALVDVGRCGARCTIGDSGEVFYSHEAACCEDCLTQDKERAMSTRMFKDFLKKFSRDAEKLIKDADKNGDDHEEPDGDEGDDNRSVHVHVHQHQAGENGDNGDDGDNKSTGDKKLGDRVAKLEDGMKAIDAKLGKVLDAMTKAKDKDDDDDKKDTDDRRARDKDDDDDKKSDDQNPFAKKDDDDKKTDDDDDDDKKDTDDDLPDKEGQTAGALGSAGPELMEADPALKTGESKMGDAAWQKRATRAMTTLITDTRTRAEILAPGLKMPAYDRAMSFKDAGDSVCTLRRAALSKALTTDTGKALLGHMTAADVKTMSCKAVRIMFLNASDRVRDNNNMMLTSGGGWTGVMDSEPRTAFEVQRNRIRAINKANAEFWNRQTGRPN